MLNALTALLVLAQGQRAVATLQIPLGPANATLSEEFSRLTSIRELSDGRVLLTDFQENRLVVADLLRDTVASIGQKGDGPGEYRRVFPLVRLGHDSTLMGNTVLHRWLIVDGTLRFFTPAADDPIVVFAQESTRLSADERGNVLSEQTVPRTSRDQTMRISFLVLASPSLKRRDTLERITRPAEEIVLAAEAARGITFKAFGTDERAVLGPDGWVGFARLRPYRVDWFPPGGPWQRGSPVAEKPVQVTAREKEAYLVRREEAQSGTGGGRPGSARSPGSDGMPPVKWEWPDLIPPFVDGQGSVLATEDGMLVVARTPTAGQVGQLYDVFDHRGSRQFQLLLPSGRRILGFGRKSVFVVSTDQDGIQRLSRHSWPVSR